MSEQRGKMLKVTLVKSPIGYNSKQKATVKSLGLRRMGRTVLIADAPQFRGMIAKVSHLVTVEEVDES
ncbi:MAG: 50S ribosomal protein L30 [Chloroflexi bacterium]|nr:50S ribosomal protein L30 [Chloroflexota bacterium]